MENVFIGSGNFHSKGVMLWNLALNEEMVLKMEGVQTVEELLPSTKMRQSQKMKSTIVLVTSQNLLYQMQKEF